MNEQQPKAASNYQPPQAMTKTPTIEDTPTPRVEWSEGVEPDEVCSGWHYGRHIRIAHAPRPGDDIACWRIRVHYGESVVQVERHCSGTLGDAKELGAWIACDLSRRDADAVLTAMRMGYCFLGGSLTHCTVIDPAGRQFDDVLIGSLGAMIDRLMDDPASGRTPEHWRASRETAKAYLRERRERREHANGSPAPTDHFAVGRTQEPTP